jgi:hypothetical protein
MCPSFFSDFNQTLIFSTKFKKTKVSNLMKIRPEGAKLFPADGRTEITRIEVAFRNYAKAPKKAWVDKQQ